jgi:hypothetical protein
MGKRKFLITAIVSAFSLAGIGAGLMLSSPKAAMATAPEIDSSVTQTSTWVPSVANGDYDLGGNTYTINAASGTGIWTDKGNLTLRNGTLNITSVDHAIQLTNGALTLENVTIVASTTSTADTLNADGINASGGITLLGNSHFTFSRSDYRAAGFSSGGNITVGGTSVVDVSHCEEGFYCSGATVTFQDNCQVTVHDAPKGVYVWGGVETVVISGGTINLAVTSYSFFSQYGNNYAGGVLSLTQTGGTVNVSNAVKDESVGTYSFTGGTFTFEGTPTQDIFQVNGTGSSFTIDGGSLKLISTTDAGKTAINLAGSMTIKSGRLELDGWSYGIGSWANASFSHTGGRLEGNCITGTAFTSSTSDNWNLAAKYLKDYYIDAFKTKIDATTCSSLQADISEIKNDYKAIYTEDVDELDSATSSAHDSMSYSALYTYYVNYATSKGWLNPSSPLAAIGIEKGDSYLAVGAVALIALISSGAYFFLRKKSHSK